MTPLRPTLLLVAVVWLAACGPSVSTAPRPAGTAPSSAPAPAVSASGALSGVTGGGPGSVAVAPFAESDAVGLRAGQPARVAVAALDGRELPATVVAVAPTPVQISGVTDYYVTVELTAGDPRLRAGQTVLVTIPTR